MIVGELKWSRRGDCDVIVGELKWSRPGPRGIGPTRRRTTCEKDCARAEMEREWSKRDRAKERKRKQRETASEDSKAKEKESDRLRKKRCIQGESRVALHLAHFLKLFRPPLCRLHRYLHMVTMDIYLHISGYFSAQGILCTCVFLVSSGILGQHRMEFVEFVEFSNLLRTHFV